MLKEINARTKLLCFLGKYAEHSLSPRIHNFSIEQLNLPYVYMAFKVDKDRVKQALNAMRTLDIRGANVSAPIKETVMEYLDELDDVSTKIGAVNTIVNDKGVLKGYNTDAKGFLNALNKNYGDVSGKSVSIIGLGGAGKAVLSALTDRNCRKINIIIREKNRTLHEYEIKRILDKSSTALDIVNIDEEFEVKKALKLSNILINATDVGMGAKIDCSPISDKGYLDGIEYVMDLIYEPRETKLLKQASDMNCKISNGLDMLIYQAQESFELFTGCNMPANSVFDKLK